MAEAGSSYRLPSAYAGLVRSSVQVAVTYRGRMVLWVLSGFFPLLLMAVWLTVVEESGPPAGWKRTPSSRAWAAS